MRKTKPKKRILLPDPKFHDVMVTRFVNNIMLQGKKSIAYSIFYDAIDMVGEKMKDSDKAPLAGSEVPTSRCRQKCVRKGRFHSR